MKKLLILPVLAFIFSLSIAHAQIAGADLSGVHLCIDDNSFSINTEGQMKDIPHQEFIDVIKSEFDSENIQYKVMDSCSEDSGFFQMLGVLDASTETHPLSLDALIFDQSKSKYDFNVVIYTREVLFPRVGTRFALDAYVEEDMRYIIREVAEDLRNANP